jgi:hypothetical protein
MRPEAFGGVVVVLVHLDLLEGPCNLLQEVAAAQDHDRQHGETDLVR